MQNVADILFSENQFFELHTGQVSFSAGKISGIFGAGCEMKFE